MGWLDYGCALLGVLSAGAAAVVVSDRATDDELPGITGWQPRCQVA